MVDCKEKKNIHRLWMFYVCMFVKYIQLPVFFSSNFFLLWMYRFLASKLVWPGRTQQGNFCLSFLLSHPSALHSMGSWSNYLFTGELIKNVAWNWIKSHISFFSNFLNQEYVQWFKTNLKTTFLKYLRKIITKMRIGTLFFFPPSNIIISSDWLNCLLLFLWN